jgi:hypothetical protein
LKNCELLKKFKSKKAHHTSNKGKKELLNSSSLIDNLKDLEEK